MDESTNLGPATVIKETDRAILVTLDDNDGEEAWIPKSCIHDDSEVYSEKSGSGDLIVQAWWAKANGF